MKIEINEPLTGSILDIGGGGECVIGQIYGKDVIAIDNCREELDEAPDCCRKILMDATALAFPDRSFDTVTFFYSLMYMNRETQEKALREALRVLKPDGTLYIRDAEISSAYPDPYIVDLDIAAGSLRIHTTYGIVKKESQDRNTFREILENAGQHPLQVSCTDGQFRIICKKA